MIRFLVVVVLAVDPDPRISDREIIEGLTDLNAKYTELKAELRRVEGELKAEFRNGGIRVWTAAVFAVAERSGPDEVDSGGFESGTEGDVFEAPDPELLDSGSTVKLEHGRLDSGPEAIVLLELRSCLKGSAPGVAELFAIVAEASPFFAVKHRALATLATGVTG